MNSLIELSDLCATVLLLLFPLIERHRHKYQVMCHNCVCNISHRIIIYVYIIDVFIFKPNCTM